MNQRIAALICLLPLTGCYSVTFVKDVGSGESVSQMHHNGIISLVEFSSPVNPTQMCGGDWASVTTSESFITAIAGGLDNAVMAAIGAYGVDIWDPQQIEVECK